MRVKNGLKDTSTGLQDRLFGVRIINAAYFCWLLAGHRLTEERMQIVKWFAQFVELIW